VLLALALVVVFMIDVADAVVLLVAILVLRDVVDDVNAYVVAQDERIQITATTGKSLSKKDWFDLQELWRRSFRW